MAARHTCWSTGPALIHILEPKDCQEEWNGVKWRKVPPHFGVTFLVDFSIGARTILGKGYPHGTFAWRFAILPWLFWACSCLPGGQTVTFQPFNLSAILAFWHSGILAIRLPRCLAARSVLRQTKPQICTNDVVSCCHCPPFLCFLRLSPAPSFFSLLNCYLQSLATDSHFVDCFSRAWALRRRQKVWTHACCKFQVASCQFTACTTVPFVSTSP